MNSRRFVSTTPIHVQVKSLAGSHWKEDWSKEKMAYFILMSDVAEPKFHQSKKTEWVPFDSNLYKWDKETLTEEEFNTFRAQWPGQKPVTFDPGSCDHVQLVFEVNQEEIGVGFGPQRNPKLFNLIVEMGKATIQYEGFRYSYGRHVFHSVLGRESIAAIATSSLASLRQISPVLSTAVDRLKRLDVRFTCREGSFEPPFQMWFEG